MLRLHHPITVAVLCSRHAPGLVHLLTRDGDRGRTYEIVCCITSDRSFFEEVRVERGGVPTLSHPIVEFYRARNASLYHDAEVRAEYDAQTAELLKPYAPDLVLLDGYLFLLTAPMLRAFHGRLLNLHFSDLTERYTDGRPRFPGVRAVRDALGSGVAETRATVHLVDAEPDSGPPLVRSWPFAVSPMVHDACAWNATDMFKAYVFAHQQWMMRAASGPLLAAALRLIATRRADIADLMARAPHTVTPWDLDEHGYLHGPNGRETAPVDQVLVTR